MEPIYITKHKDGRQTGDDVFEKYCVHVCMPIVSLNVHETPVDRHVRGEGGLLC